MANSDNTETRPPIFTETDIKAIAGVLNKAEVSSLQDHWRIKVVNLEEKRHLSIYH